MSRFYTCYATITQEEEQRASPVPIRHACGRSAFRDRPFRGRADRGEQLPKLSIRGGDGVSLLRHRANFNRTWCVLGIGYKGRAAYGPGATSGPTMMVTRASRSTRRGRSECSRKNASEETRRDSSPTASPKREEVDRYVSMPRNARNDTTNRTRQDLPHGKNVNSTHINIQTDQDDSARNQEAGATAAHQTETRRREGSGEFCGVDALSYEGSKALPVTEWPPRRGGVPAPTRDGEYHRRRAAPLGQRMREIHSRRRFFPSRHRRIEPKFPLKNPHQDPSTMIYETQLTWGTRSPPIRRCGGQPLRKEFLGCWEGAGLGQRRS